MQTLMKKVRDLTLSVSMAIQGLSLLSRMRWLRSYLLPWESRENKKGRLHTLVVSLKERCMKTHSLSSAFSNVFTAELAVNWSRDTGQSRGELKEDVMDHVAGQRAQILSHQF